MLNRVTIAETTFERIIRRLGSQPSSVLACPAGISQLPHVREVLVRTAPVHSPSLRQGQPRVLVTGAVEAAALRPALTTLAEHDPGIERTVLAIGVGPAAGHLAGALVPAGIRRLEPLDALVIPGIARVPLGSGVPPGWPVAPPVPPGSMEIAESIWSRTMGALGTATWTRLTSWRVALIGCGRTGSLVALSLARLGIHRIALIDPDVLEPHNVGEMDGVGLADVGSLKAEALARLVRSRLRDTLGATADRSVTAIASSVRSVQALAAVKEADLLVCCVDNPAARLAAAFLAAIYLKPLLDIGTGILRAARIPGPHPPARQMGADVRLVLPGRCLLCLGDIAGIEEARAHLLNRGADSKPGAVPVPWQQQRAGSLRSLNQVAVGTAMRLLEDLAAGTLRRSVWLHFEFSGEGIPAVEDRGAQGRFSCRLCALAAGGDADLGSLPLLLSQIGLRAPDPRSTV